MNTIAIYMLFTTIRVIFVVVFMILSKMTKDNKIIDSVVDVAQRDLFFNEIIVLGITCYLEFLVVIYLYMRALLAGLTV